MRVCMYARAGEALAASTLGADRLAKLAAAVASADVQVRSVQKCHSYVFVGAGLEAQSLSKYTGGRAGHSMHSQPTVEWHGQLPGHGQGAFCSVTAL